MGDFATAEQKNDTAIEINRNIAEKSPSSQLSSLNLATTLENAGKTQLLKHDYEHALAYLSESLSIFDSVPKGDLGWAGNLERVSIARYKAIALYHLSRFDEADALTKSVYKDAEKMFIQHPEIPDAVDEFSYFCGTRANILSALGRDRAAQDFVDSANNLIDKNR